MFDFNIDVQQQATAVSYFTFIDETYSYSL